MSEINPATAGRTHGHGAVPVRPIRVSPQDVGHAGAARDRVYIIMAHRDRVVETYDVHKMFRTISTTFQKLAQTRVQDYYVADAIDLAMEMENTARTRKIPLKPKANWRQSP